VVEANDEDMRDLAASVDTAAKLGAFSISNSYSANEDGNPEEYKRLAPSYDHPGIPIVAAAGDETFSAGAQVPAAYPSVIAVGGTTLAGGRRETAWSGTTSACSAVFPKPAWQQDKGCVMRTIADVAFDADPATLIQTYDSTPTRRGGAGWAAGGGTSYGAPAIAAIYALAGYRASNAASLYAPGQLTDITSGSDGGVDARGACIRPGRYDGGNSSSYLCVARSGYDAPSGNGSPRGLCGFGVLCAKRR
jgi:subtilase family serine protease